MKTRWTKWLPRPVRRALNLEHRDLMKEYREAVALCEKLKLEIEWHTAAIRRRNTR